MSPPPPPPTGVVVTEFDIASTRSSESIPAGTVTDGSPEKVSLGIVSKAEGFEVESTHSWCGSDDDEFAPLPPPPEPPSSPTASNIVSQPQPQPQPQPQQQLHPLPLVPIFSGWLRKQSGVKNRAAGKSSLGSWRRKWDARYFEFDGSSVRWYKTQPTSAVVPPKGEYALGPESQLLLDPAAGTATLQLCHGTKGTLPLAASGPITLTLASTVGTSLRF
eukprot:SAG11_NODE_1811_length_4220_cov_3.963601_1_plen_219_part_00